MGEGAWIVSCSSSATTHPGRMLASAPCPQGDCPVQAAQASESAPDLSFPGPGSDFQSNKVQGWQWGNLLTGFYPS